jgi:UDP-glucose:(heptosyl)LPS alpha-1,3-glucosyltransferase
VALFIAMNYHLKGLEPLLRSVHLVKHKQCCLLVAGNRHTGPYERLARRLGVRNRVRFIGYCADARDCYFAADFLVHPTFYDPCSLVVLEAQACGLPDITSRFNGASELLDPPHDGYVVDDPHDHEHLAWCIEQLLDPARRVSCSQAVRSRAGRWNFEAHYRQLMAILREVQIRKQAA